MFEQPTFTPHEVNDANHKLQLFLDQFKAFSKTVVLHLVDQLRVPEKEWQLLPLRNAGYAGGQKFVVGKVFFKFARDDKELYGADDDLAAKMGQNDVRNLNALLSLRLSGL